MNFSNDILDELSSLSPLLAGMEKINVFSVPDKYFNNLDEGILGAIKENDISLINGLSKESLFDTPKDYFENLPGIILTKINASKTVSTEDELSILSPMLYSLQAKNVFEAPAGYFNTVAGSILDKAKPQPAKIVKMQKHNVFFKYASAAMIAVILALGVYKFVNKPEHGVVANSLTVASLDPSIQNGIKMNDKQFDQTLNTLSDDDIANYLVKNGSDADMSELSSDIDDNSLPSQDQYLSDDKTLDNYLSDDNSKQKDNN